MNTPYPKRLRAAVRSCAGAIRFSRLFNRSPGKPAKSPRVRQQHFECLEHRCLLSVGGLGAGREFHAQAESAQVALLKNDHPAGLGVYSASPMAQQSAARIAAPIRKLVREAPTMPYGPRLEHRTGSLDPTDEQLLWKRENLIQTSEVKLNELGLERLEQQQSRPAASQNDLLGSSLLAADTEMAAMGLYGPGSLLPKSVDNSTLQYFPGIRDQGGLGSCVPFSATYYTLTYMTAMARGWDASNPADNTTKFSPKWTYNMVNDGVDGGANLLEVMSVLADHGAPTWAEVPYSGSTSPLNYREWVYDNPQIWRNAIQYRPNDMGYVSDVASTDGMQRVKTLLANGYLLNYSTYINSWQYRTIGNDPSTTDDDYAVGKKAAYWVNGTEGGHVMAVVGYDDSIWVDVNSNGSVDSGEKGAFRIANSWGTSWSPGGVNDGGFTWLAYDALKGVSAVSGGPSTGRQPAWRSYEAYWMNAREDYTPSLLAQFDIQHGNRYQFSVTLGTADAGQTTPERTWTPTGLSYDGGAYGFDGNTYATTSAASVGTFVLDFTNLGASYGTSTTYFLGVNDNADAAIEATVSSFKLTDSLGNVLASSTNVPITDADGYETIVYTSVESTLTDFVVDSNWVNVDEGATGTIGVKLASAPAGDVTVSADWISGDSDLFITSGGSLVFTTSNWDSYQTVEISAAQDVDSLNGEATLQFTAAGLRPRTVKATEVDDDAIYVAMMDSDPGWSYDPQWAWGTPLGGGGYRGSPDPASGATGTTAIGYNLAGDYENNLSLTQWVTTTPIDCSGYEDVELRFYRWLGVETSTYDRASIEVSNDGAAWTEIWSNSGEIADSFWSLQTFGISAIADGQASVQIRWGMGMTDSSVTYCGWNIDDVALTGTLVATPSTAPASIDLVSSSDTGASDSDDLTKYDNSDSGNVLQFDVTGTIPGAEVRIYADGTEIGLATAIDTTTTVTTDGAFDLVDGPHTITATQKEPGKVESAPTEGLAITVDTSPPEPIFAVVPPTQPDFVIDSIAIDFDQPVAGLDPNDFGLTRDGTTVVLTGSTVTPSDPGDYSLSYTLGSLAPLAANPGAYILTLHGAGMGIVDSAGNELQVDATIGWATLSGTTGNDTISVSSTATEHVVRINTDEYRLNAAFATEIYLDGAGGRDRITIVGTDGGELATLQPGSVDVQHLADASYPEFWVHGTNIEEVTVNASAGDDTVIMTGSSESNRFYSHPNYSTLRDIPGSFSFRVEGFETATVEAPGSGSDYAFLYDSPNNDELLAEPEKAVFTRSAGTAAETVTTENGFRQVYAYASDGDDTAGLTGSATGANRFYGYADYSLFTDTTRSFYFYARGFDAVTATSPEAAIGYAYLYDSPGFDEFEASTTSATMDRKAPWSDTTANGFARIYAYSTKGGGDKAKLNGSTAGGNTFYSYPTHSTLYDAARSFYHYVRGFGSVTAFASIADSPGDRAYLYDSSGDDTLSKQFFENDKYQGGRLTDGLTYENWFKYFDVVYARSSDQGTTDTIEGEQELAYRLIEMGSW